MRVLFLTHYYPPELGAPQTRLQETAQGLQDLGHEVRILTGPPHYPDGIVRPGYSAWRIRRERRDGVSVTRLPMVPRPNRGFVDRAIDQASFAAAALVAGSIIEWSDVVLVESPPLFLGATAAFHRLLIKRPYLLHVADPWPDFPIAMGALRNPLAIRVARSIESLAYRHASMITTVSPGLVRLIERNGAASGKVRLLPNAVDVRRFAPERPSIDARRQLGWPEARLTLAYVGSVGLAQGVGTLIEALAPLADEGIVLHVVGEGFERDRLARDVRLRGFRHIRFEASVPPSAVPDVLAASDAVVVMLRSGRLYEQSLPTKLAEGLAAGRPIVVSATGDASKAVVDAEAGLTAPAEDVVGLRDAVLQMAGSGDRDGMGRRARQVAEQRYDRRAIVGRLEGFLAEVVDGAVDRHSASVANGAGSR